MELCVILEKQLYCGELLPMHTAEMLRHACKDPNVNASAIVDRGLSELGYTYAINPLYAFGMAVGKEMAVIPARILPSPSVQYGHGIAHVDDRARWSLQNIKFVQGGRLTSWAVLNIHDRHRSGFNDANGPELRRIVGVFADMCRRSGISIPPNAQTYLSVTLPPKNREDPLRKAAIHKIQTTMLDARPKPAMFLVVLSNHDPTIYEGLKHLCDVLLGVATVCVQAEKIRRERGRGQQQYFSTVALKVNMKTGGVNHRLNDRNSAWIKKEPTMLVGMDVTHPKRGQAVPRTPSIAAVVASIDMHQGQFPASLRIQESRKVVSSVLRSLTSPTILTIL